MSEAIAPPETRTKEAEQLADRYLALWTEPEPERRRRMIAELWTEDGSQVLQPPQEMREIAASAGLGMAASLEARGHAELEARAATSYEQWVGSAGLSFRRRDDVYRLHKVVKFHREAVSPATGPRPILEVDDVSDGPLGPHVRRRPRDGGGVMTTVKANGVTLGVEHFGDAAAPLVLLAGGTTMLSWPDALCAALARGGRHVVRYDLRDSGASTTVDPDAPAYTLRDLAAVAAALARELDDRPAHLAGIGVGGIVAQVAALDHPDAFSAVILAGTRPVAPGPLDDDLPDHDAATMDRLFSRSMPDWSDRAAVAEFAAGGAEILGDDPAAARTTAQRKWDRTPGTEPAVQMANQLGMVFSKLDCKPRWRERLSELAIPALVVHGRRDPFFPVGNGEALAREIPGARLLVLEGAATAIPDAAASEVAAAMLALWALKRIPCGTPT